MHILKIWFLKEGIWLRLEGVKLLTLLFTKNDQTFSISSSQVSCGGCHMLVIARPRQENGFAAEDDESLGESNEIENNNKPSVVGEMIRRGELSDSIDLSGSIKARTRRRERLPVCHCFTFDR